MSKLVRRVRSIAPRFQIPPLIQQARLAKRSTVCCRFVWNIAGAHKVGSITPIAIPWRMKLRSVHLGEICAGIGVVMPFGRGCRTPTFHPLHHRGSDELRTLTLWCTPNVLHEHRTPRTPAPVLSISLRSPTSTGRTVSL